MTDSVSGSSLLQARDVVDSSHHQNYHNNHIRSHHNHERLHQRQADDSSSVVDSGSSNSDSGTTSASVVHVIQTVSVIQYIDSTGATVSATTQTSEPTTTQFTAEPTTVGIESEPDAISSIISSTSASSTSSTDIIVDASATASFGIESLPDSTTYSADDAVTVISSVSPATASSVDPASAVETASSSTESTSSADAASSSSMVSSFPTVESFASITSTPLSTSAFPTFTGVANSTTTASSSETASSSASSTSNDTLTAEAFTSYLTTSTLAHSSGTILYNDTYTTTLGVYSSSSSTFASITGTATSTRTSDGSSATGLGYGGDNSDGSGSAATGDSAASATSTSDSGSSSNSNSNSASAGTVAGSVIGAVAGLGLILIAALMLLRYKKRHGMRLSDGNGGLPGAGNRAIGNGGPPNSPGGAGEMSQRSTPFAVQSALASLTGKRSSQRTIASGSTERGFQKVSGRKLPSVLQHGGDGYSEPSNVRDTMLTEGSYYRDSQGSLAGPDMPRLAVGSPMRPESGIPVFHAGPARMPITEASYFAAPSLSPPPRDPVGRSHASADGSSIYDPSHGSGSRFTEEI
ncbi:hypothetical protein PFICI_10868 [Pestalotiopsis fici W106-1]|uniref:Uncharacterized protein n=1 Tax=Pestalotiopsis fici (strain W106-1 / CGMCC3.15140) TaxID=1229662 RepID=W3WT47_PESFW|nr:uncharacterized protein PFICI_10868 [Pestalotiopsis fici W106-1]ETS76994.1 hypothetical protein PFICI_10868 [Pestalotiopsis fici W106-1]